MVLLLEEEKQPNGRFKERQSAEGAHLSELQKAHTTSKCILLS